MGDHSPAPAPRGIDYVFPPPLCGPALPSFLQHRADASGGQGLLEAMPAQALPAHQPQKVLHSGPPISSMPLDLGPGFLARPGLCSAHRFALLTMKTLLCHLDYEDVVSEVERECGWDTLLNTDTHHYTMGLLAR